MDIYGEVIYEENYEEAIAVKNKRNLKVEVVKVSSLKDAINYLEGLE